MEPSALVEGAVRPFSSASTGKPAAWAARRWVACAAVLGCCLGARSARAEPVRASLEVIRAAGTEACPDGVKLAQRIEEMAGAKILSGPELKPVALELLLERQGKGYRGKLTISGERKGERVIEDAGPDCDGLQEAVAVSILLVLDALPGVVPPPPAPEPPLEPAPLPPEPPSLPQRSGSVGALGADRSTLRPWRYFLLPAVAPTRDPVREPERRPLFAASVGVVYDSGTLDGASGGVLLSADAFIPWASFQLGVLLLPRDEITLTERTVVFEHYGARLRACGQPLAQRLSLGLCTGFAAGGRMIRVQPSPDRADDRGAYVAATFEIDVAGAIADHISVFATAGVSMPMLAAPISIELPGNVEVGLLESAPAFQLVFGPRLGFDL